MPYIEIIAGTFGHSEGGRIVPKTPESGPFKVADKVASRLIKLKVARKVDVEEEIEVDAPIEEPVDVIEDQEDENVDAESDGITEPANDAESVESDEDTEDDSIYDGMTKPQLQEMLKERGIEFKSTDKRDVLVALLEEADSEESQPPEISTADPVE